MTDLKIKGIILILVGLAGLLILTIQSGAFHTPKFEVGQCAAYLYDANEFEPETVSPLRNKILRVGKKDYMYIRFIQGGYTTTVVSVDSIKYFDDNNVLIDCETGERL